nr:MAG: peptidase S8 [Pseudomonadota bacterium]
MRRPVPVFLGSVILGAALASPVMSGPISAVQSSNISQLALPAARNLSKIDESLANATGEVDVIVQLSEPPLAVANGENARRVGGRFNRAQQIAHSAKVRAEQDALHAQLLALGGREIGRVRIAYNAVIVRIAAEKLSSIARLSNVKTIRPVGEYRLALENTVPYIGASSVQGSGYDGTGIRIAVLDSGIDYTHRNLGGPGTVEAYEAAYGTDPSDPRNRTLDGLFPTAKVIGGWDFVGEEWPNGPLAEDPDPIDFGGHGTHVADIIAGRSPDGSHVGVAPGALLYAVKVCSAVSTSCNGAAMLRGIDFAMDPNGDGSMDDAVDIINLSIGAGYGQIEDDIAGATANAVRAGVVVVAAAGNNGDRPYITASPASTPGVISVANTQVPTALAVPLVINSPAAIAGTYTNTATIDWAPIGDGVTGDVVYVGRGCRDDETTPEVEPQDPYLADPAGRIALIDRGDCAVSVKIDRAAKAGAIGVLLGLVAPGDAVSFSQGGGDTFVPSLVIIQSYADLIRAQLAAGATVNVTVSEANAIPLVGSVITSSSRGPSHSFNHIKPDIAAPGGSVSAEVGTGSGMTPFSGTSGASPMVAGAAALLLQAYPKRTPAEIKSILMNTADPELYINPVMQPGVLAPITRIGAGEVRVDAALASTTAAWDAKLGTGSLSFGYHTVSEPVVLHRHVRVRNYASYARRYSITTSFRYADDEASGAVKIHTPSSIVVGPHGTSEFVVTLTIDPRKLPEWTLNGGPFGGDGFRLQGVEFDGFVHLRDGRDQIHLPWHVLPHRAADVRAVNRNVKLFNGENGSLVLLNTSRALAGRVDVFSLTGTSPRIPRSQLPGEGDNVAVVDLAAVGARLVSIGGGQFGIQFAINTYGQRAHPAYPGGFEVDIDTDLDGNPDWFVFNRELGQAFSTGQTVVYVQRAGTTTATAYFYADADLNSGNIILTAPLSVMGLTPTSTFSFTVYAYDNYFTGLVSDVIENMVYTPAFPRFFVPDAPADGVPAGGFSVLTVEHIPEGDEASPSQTGLLLMYRDAPTNREAEAVKVDVVTKPPKGKGDGKGKDKDKDDKGKGKGKDKHKDKDDRGKGKDKDKGKDDKDKGKGKEKDDKDKGKGKDDKGKGKDKDDKGKGKGK